MKESRPPSLATWMLRHLVPGERNDAIAGDLLEEFRCGRSDAWYWRQVVTCIAVNFSRDVYANSGALLFAGLWALLAPVYIPPLPPLTIFPRLDGAFWKVDANWRLAYPWSNICNLGLTLLLMISFLWIGLLLYLTLESLSNGRFSFPRLNRGMLRSAAVFIPLWVATWTIPPIFSGSSGTRLFSSEAIASHSSPSPALSPYALFTMAKLNFWIACTPLFIAFVWAIWDVSRARNTRKQP